MKNSFDSMATNKNSTVISASELQRIKESIAHKIIDPHENDHRIKEELHTTAKNIVKKWPNTIEANRRKKEEEKLRQKTEEEMKRRELDEQEAQYQHSLRKEAIEKASQAQFVNQDHVKAFNSKLLLADTLKERDEQMVVKKMKDDMEKEIEKDWENTEKETMKEYDEKEKIKNDELSSQKQINAHFIRQQKAEAELKKTRVAKENKIEGELIKKQVENELLNEYEREYIKKINSKELAERLKKDNDNIRKMKEVKRQQEKDEIKQIEEFANQRYEFENMLKEREKEKFDEKQKTRQKMVDIQFDKLKSFKNKEEERLNSQIKEAEEKELREFEEKERKNKEAIESLNEFRKRDMERKSDQKKKTQEIDEEFKTLYQKRNEELSEIQIKEQMDIRNRSKLLAEYQKNQMSAKKGQAEEEFLNERREAAKALALKDQEGRQFYSYAEKCLKEWNDSGKNVKPLILELKTKQGKLFQ